MTLPPGVLTALEILAMIAGVAYAILAARRNRLCWVAGAVSSACAAVVSWQRALPMQAGLQFVYVGMSVYGWANWTRASAAGAQVPVGVWPLRWHLAAAAGLAGLSLVSAHLLAAETRAAWPLMDSATTWFSLFATWLATRAKLENWLYWIVIDGVLVFLFYVQGAPFLALLNVLFIGIATAGFISWRRAIRTQAVPA